MWRIHWRKPAFLRFDSKTRSNGIPDRVKVCKESVGICKGVLDAGFDVICITAMERLLPGQISLRPCYSFLSATQRDTDVASLRGAKRVD